VTKGRKSSVTLINQNNSS